MNIGDLFFGLRAPDGSQLTIDAQKAAEAAGVKGSESFSAAFQKNMGKVGAMAIGATLGGLYSAAMTGATQLNELAGEYQVQTGASAAEAKVFSGVLNDLYANAHQSYQEISDTLIGLKTHFNLDGQAARELAASVLDFAEIAGGTGAEAVERLNTLVKTGMIDQSQMGVTMDKLVASRQKYGIVINDEIDTLIKFAPAAKAANFTMDESLGLATMFSKAGVTADRAMQGFSRAMAKAKSPAEFKAMLADIANTPDDFTRAQKAIDLFGVRAGPQLANILRPGQGAIADFIPTVDEYTGAVAKAGQVNDSTFGGQALLLIHKFQAALTEMGAGMGDFLIPVAILGPKLTQGLSIAMGGLGGLFTKKLVAEIATGTPAVVAAGAAKGGAAGTAEGAAEAAAVAAAQPAVAAAVTSGTPEVVAAAAAEGTEAGAAMAGAQGGTGMLGAIGAALTPAALIAIGAVAIAGLAIWSDNVTSEKIAKMKTDTDAELAKVKADAQKIGPGGRAIVGTNKLANAADTEQARRHQQGLDLAAAAQAREDYQPLLDASKAMYKAIPDAITIDTPTAEAAYRKLLNAQIDATRNSKSAFTSAWQDALDATVQPQKIHSQLLANEAAQRDKTLRKNLKSHTYLVRAAAQQQLKDLQNQHLQLLAQDATYGTAAEKRVKLNALLQSKAMKDGLASTDEDVKAQWNQVYEDTLAELERIDKAVRDNKITASITWQPTVHESSGGGGGYALGTDYVPATGWYRLHKAERVVTAADNAAIAQGQAILAAPGAAARAGGMTVNFNGQVTEPRKAVRALYTYQRLGMLDLGEVR